MITSIIIPMLLAQSMPVPPDAMISSTAVVGIIGAVTTLVVGVIGKLKIDAARSQANDVTLRKPVPVIETREKQIYALKADVDAALGRFQDSHNKCQRYQDSQHAANQKRLDDQVKALARMEGTLASVQETTTTLLNLALNRKPPARQ